MSINILILIDVTTNSNNRIWSKPNDTWYCGHSLLWTLIFLTTASHDKEYWKNIQGLSFCIYRSCKRYSKWRRLERERKKRSAYLACKENENVSALMEVVWGNQEKTSVHCSAAWRASIKGSYAKMEGVWVMQEVDDGATGWWTTVRAAEAVAVAPSAARRSWPPPRRRGRTCTSARRRPPRAIRSRDSSPSSTANTRRHLIHFLTNPRPDISHGPLT